MKKFKLIAIVAVIIALIIGGLYAVNVFKNNTSNDLSSNESNAQIDITYLKKSVEKIGELRTAKITYGCLSEFKEGKYPLITKTAFSMYYNVTAEAGIEIDKIEITLDNNGKFIVKLPEPKLYDVRIDMSSIKIFNKSRALFNWSTPEDMQEALKIAEEDVKKQAATDQILDIANDKAFSVIENLLGSFLAKDQFEVVSSEKTS